MLFTRKFSVQTNAEPLLHRSRGRAMLRLDRRRAVYGSRRRIIASTSGRTRWCGRLVGCCQRGITIGRAPQKSIERNGGKEPKRPRTNQTVTPPDRTTTKRRSVLSRRRTGTTTASADDLRTHTHTLTNAYGDTQATGEHGRRCAYDRGRASERIYKGRRGVIRRPWWQHCNNKARRHNTGRQLLLLLSWTRTRAFRPWTRCARVNRCGKTRPSGGGEWPPVSCTCSARSCSQVRCCIARLGYLSHEILLLFQETPTFFQPAVPRHVARITHGRGGQITTFTFFFKWPIFIHLPPLSSKNNK